MQILLIEDNETIVKGLVYALEKNNYRVLTSSTFKESEALINKESLALIILDITLPDGNGFDLLKKVIINKNIPTIILSALDLEDDIVKGLNMGAEDYLTKPFSTKELLARINKILMRKNGTLFKIKDISFDMDKMQVYKNGEKVPLTALELKLLQLLVTNKNKVVTRSMILDTIYEVTGNDVDLHTITVYFKRIREKLNTDIIVTIKGIGYRIDEK